MSTPQTRLFSDPEELLRHTTWVRSLVRSLVRDAAWRDDIEQDTWLAALAARPAGLTNTRAWLARVARNAFRQRARADMRREDREFDAMVPDPPPGVDALSEQAELQRRVVREVLELETKLRETMLLHFFQGLSAAEIARQQGCPASTVRDRMRRGLEKLRRRFEADFPERRARIRALGVLLTPLRNESVSRGSWSLALAAGVGIACVVALLLFDRGGTVSVAPPELLASNDGRPGIESPELSGVHRPVRSAVRVAMAEAASDSRSGELERPHDGARGVVVDPMGLPVPRATVSVAQFSAYSTSPRAVGIDATTNGDGMYRLPVSLAHRAGLVLVAARSGFAPELVDFEDHERIVLEPAATLRIRVVEKETGRAIEGARFTTGEYDWHGGLERPSTTDGDGRLTFDRAPIGKTLYARVAAPGHAFQSLRIDVPHAGPLDVECAVERGRTLNMRVHEDGRPVSSAEIVVDFARVGRTRSDGTFELHGVVGDERFTLEVAHPDFAPTRWRFRASELQSGAPMEIPVVRGCTLTGTVCDQEGRPMSHARVALLHGDGSRPSPPFGLTAGLAFASQFSGTTSARTDTEGQFRIERIAPWTHWRGVRARDPQTGRAVDVPALHFDSPGEERALEITFPPGSAVVHGRFSVGQRGLVSNGAWRGPRTSGSFETDDDGHYRIEELEAGSLELEFDVESRGLVHIERLDLTESAVIRHDVNVADSGVVLAGRVVHADGTPAAGQSVTAFDEDRSDSNVNGETDENGAFEFHLDSSPGASLTLLLHYGPLVISRHPIPAGTRDLEVTLPQLTELTVTAEHARSVSVAFRGAGDRSFSVLPSSAVSSGGPGRFRVQIPAGRADLRISMPGTEGAPTILEGVEISPTGETIVAVPGG